MLVNNAGVMVPPAGSKSAQGYELQTATNVYGHFLFTVLLMPILKKTAKTAETGSVRVSWASSLGADVMAPKEGVLFGTDGLIDESMGSEKMYGQTKAADLLLAVEAAHRWGPDGILSNVRLS